MALRVLTPLTAVGSLAMIAALVGGGCGAESDRRGPVKAAANAGESPDTRTPTQRPAPDRPHPDSAAPAPAPESALGVADVGIFSDLDPQVQIALPADIDARSTRAVVDPGHNLLVLYAHDWPVKVYPLDGDDPLRLGTTELALRPGDRAELEPLLSASALSQLAPGAAPEPGDADGDGIPDPLDLLIGARKTVLNRADYGAGYILLDFPGGDVPRHQGVCTDVVIRAVRNLGVDLQLEVNRDIKRSRRSYPMVKRANPHIDHRRVKTLLPYFKRHWDEHTATLDNPDDPLRPGDVVFMDTFPRRSGPDHIGVVSNRIGDSGYPLVINNWTDGYRTGELDLLGWVPVTHRFRIASASQ